MTSVTDADFALFMFSNFYTHKSLYKTLKKAEKNKKSIIGLLSFLSLPLF